MKVRKFLAVLMAVMMLVSSMGMTAFADENQGLGDLNGLNWKQTDAVVLVQVENPYCTEIVKIADKLQAQIKCTLNGEERVVATVDVEKAQITDEDEMALWLGVGIDAVEDDIMAQLKALQSEIDFKAFLNMDTESEEDMAAAEELAIKLTDIMTSYKVELTGPNGETYGDHYNLNEEGSTLGMVITSDLVNALMDLAGTLLGVEVTEATTVTELLEAGLSFLFDEEMTLEEALAEMEMTEEEVSEIMELISQAEEVLSYMRSEEYEGTVFAGVTLTCDCNWGSEIDWSELDWEYEIQHVYYAENADGKLEVVGTANYGPEFYDFGDGTGYYYYPGEYGQVISGYENRANEFEGKEYKYIGSYDIFLYEYYYDYETEVLGDIPEEEWAEWEVEEFTLDENSFVYGLVLRYVLDEDAVGIGDATSDPDNTDTNKQETDKGDITTEENEDGNDDDKEIESKVPSTGDETNITLYVMMALVSLGAAFTLVMARKRHGEK